jgi:hypothetical protein
MLQTFNPDLPTTVETNASNKAARGCLTQLHKDRKRRPCFFYLRKFTPAKENYNVHDKELLAIVVAFKQ